MARIRMARISTAAMAALLVASACGGSEDDGRRDDIGTGNSSSSATGSSSTSTSGSTSSGGGVMTTSSSSQGSGGAPSCPKITLGSNVSTDTEAGGSSLAYEVLGLDPAKSHIAFIEFYDAAGAQQPGSFDLSAAPDDNYQSCAHCLLVYENFSDSSPIAYFPRAGTMAVTEADTSFAATSAGSLSDVLLEEVTVMNTVTTPVLGGRCLSLPSASWDTTP